MNESIYETVPSSYEGADETIKKTDIDGKVWFIPADPNNTDYQEYIKYLENQGA